MKQKPRTIAELREELAEKPVIEFGRHDNGDNTLQILPDILRSALRPLNNKDDCLVIPGWNGILPVKPLRDWLEFAPGGVLNVLIQADRLVIAGERTRAVFLRGAMRHNPKSLLVKMPVTYQLIPPGPRPTRSELMTILNRERGKILNKRRERIKEQERYPLYVQPGRLEVIERDTKDALTALYRAFGRMQSKTWAEYATPGYLEHDSSGLPQHCQAMYAEIVAFRDAHNVTESEIFKVGKESVCSY